MNCLPAKKHVHNDIQKSQKLCIISYVHANASVAPCFKPEDGIQRENAFKTLKLTIQLHRSREGDEVWIMHMA